MRRETVDSYDHADTGPGRSALKKLRLGRSATGAKRPVSLASTIPQRTLTFQLPRPRRSPDEREEKATHRSTQQFDITTRFASHSSASSEGSRLVGSAPRTTGNHRSFGERILSRSRRAVRSEQFIPSSWVRDRKISSTSGERVHAALPVSFK